MPYSAGIIHENARRGEGAKKEMISYEELCQALDLFNNRQKNAAEMAALEQSEEAGDFEQMQPGFPMGEEPASTPDSEVNPETMRSMPTAVDVLNDETATEPPITASEEIPAAEMTVPPSEDTQEIDVDDVEIEEK